MEILQNDLVLTVALFVLVVFTVGGIAWGLFYPRLSKNHERDQRLTSIRMSKMQVADSRLKAAAHDRRKDIEASLKQIEELENEGRKKKATLSSRLAQAGLETTVKKFWLYSAACSMVCFLIAFVSGLGLWISLGVAFVGLVGLPNLWLSRRRKKRMNAFIKEFPNAIDVIVRGVRTGLPLGDCLAIAATETSEPVRSEFKRIVEEQAMGLPIATVVPRMHERVPLAETNFFAIVIAIQSQAGGSLSEALGNLSRVLRSRAQMKEKISAMSMEAKASAAIIGAMPFVICFLTYLTAPDYISMLFTTKLGHMLLGATLVWMSFGVLMMKSMISFDI